MTFNALYFRGNWTTKFTQSQTKKPFHVSSTEEKLVDTLYAEDEFETGKVDDLNAWALDLPYQVRIWLETQLPTLKPINTKSIFSSQIPWMNLRKKKKKIYIYLGLLG